MKFFSLLKKIIPAAFAALLLIGGSGLAGDVSCAYAEGSVIAIQLNDDTINPITADYISAAVDQAERTAAECLVIQLDTPGGLLISTRQIVKRILSAKVPVVVYISPSGSRAGSAGVFITYASHIAAMAPSTNIGAAHPVEFGKEKERGGDSWEGLKELLEEANQVEKSSEDNTPADKKDKSPALPKSESKKSVSKPVSEDLYRDPDPMASKILEDTVAFIRSIAKTRGRNEDWAVKSVVKSSSITGTEALELGVIDLIAKDMDDLLAQLDGRTVLIDGNEHILKTKFAPVTRIDMDARQRFFNVLANPNIAYILLVLGFYGLLYEVTHPGFGVPGVLGAIFLILAFYSMQTLPTNYAGLALLILGIVLFIAEAFVPGFGMLALGGGVCMFLGSLLLFESSLPAMRVSMSLILALTMTTAGITIFLIRAVLAVHRRRPLSGVQGMIGLKGEVFKDIPSVGEGKVFVHGEIWNAIADQPLEKGRQVIVTVIDGMTVKVEPQDKSR